MKNNQLTFTSLFDGINKKAIVSMPAFYGYGKYRFFANINGRIKEFTFNTLKTAAHARRFVASRIQSKGYQICF